MKHAQSTLIIADCFLRYVAGVDSDVILSRAVSSARLEVFIELLPYDIAVIKGMKNTVKKACEFTSTISVNITQLPVVYIELNPRNYARVMYYYTCIIIPPLGKIEIVL